VGQRQTVKLAAGSRAAALYDATEAVEDYFCNYGVNPAHRELLDTQGMRVTGVGDAGEVRVVEIPGHRFFLATLFLPQARSAPGKPHPLLAGFASALAP
jgi:CTP synthase (UTP-ammonia lyase)